MPMGPSVVRIQGLRSHFASLFFWPNTLVARCGTCGKPTRRHVVGHREAGIKREAPRSRDKVGVVWGASVGGVAMGARYSHFQQRRRDTAHDLLAPFSCQLSRSKYDPGSHGQGLASCLGKQIHDPDGVGQLHVSGSAFSRRLSGPLLWGLTSAALIGPARRTCRKMFRKALACSRGRDRGIVSLAHRRWR